MEALDILTTICKKKFRKRITLLSHRVADKNYKTLKNARIYLKRFMLSLHFYGHRRI